MVICGTAGGISVHLTDDTNEVRDLGWSLEDSHVAGVDDSNSTPLNQWTEGDGIAKVKLIGYRIVDDAGVDTYAVPDTIAYSDTHADRDRFADGDAYDHTDANTYAHRLADRHAYDYTHANAHRLANRHAGGRPGCRAQRPEGGREDAKPGDDKLDTGCGRNEPGGRGDNQRRYEVRPESAQRHAKLYIHGSEATGLYLLRNRG